MNEKRTRLPLDIEATVEAIESNAWTKSRSKVSTGTRAARGARRRGLHRDLAEFAGEKRPPRIIAAVLAEPELYGPRFTPLQWVVLVTRWRVLAPPLRNRDVARALNESPDTTRQATQAAEALAVELVDVWRPLLDRWRAGERDFTPEERACLDRNRKAKTGRRPVYGYAGPPEATPPTDPDEGRSNVNLR